jgi:hypothetical protein
MLANLFCMIWVLSVAAISLYLGVGSIVEYLGIGSIVDLLTGGGDPPPPNFVFL